MLPFLDNPVNRRLGLVATLAHSAYGKVEQPGRLWHFEGQELALDRAPPQVGEHSDEILSELGFSAAEVATLKASRAVA